MIAAAKEVCPTHKTSHGGGHARHRRGDIDGWTRPAQDAGMRECLPVIGAASPAPIASCVDGDSCMVRVGSDRWPPPTLNVAIGATASSW